MHSWRVLILPYLDEHELHERYRFDEPWDGPHNSQLADEIPFAYRCPSFDGFHVRRGLNTQHLRRLTNYVAITSPRSAMDGTFPRMFREVTDGLSNTVVVADVRGHSVHWMQPDDVTFPELLVDLQAARRADDANHLNGVQMLLLDGSVRFISSETSPDRLRATITRDGGEAETALERQSNAARPGRVQDTPISFVE